MNEQQPRPGAQPEPTREDLNSALFANLVVQQTNMAFMFLGQLPNPESGEKVIDLETAKVFIDTLEMLEAKTKGNLDKREESLLKRNLTALRMAFVEASNQEPQRPEQKRTEASAETPAGKTEPSPAPSEEADSRKKFSKKY